LIIIKKWLFVCFFILLLLSSCIKDKSQQRFSVQSFGYFDSFVVFIAYALNEEEFDRYADIVFDRLGEYHRLYDIFNSYEGLNNLYQINKNAGINPLPVEQKIIDLLEAAVEAYHLTDGMVNVAMGSVLRIWHEHRQNALQNPENATLPCFNTLTAAAAFTDINGVIINREDNTVFLKTQGMSLDVGSIAKGFAAEQTINALIQAGVEAALINLGGHVIAYGQPPGKNGWETGLAHQPDTITLFNESLSVSGAYERFYTVGDQRFGHIIDPRTQMPANKHEQVAVVHTSSWMADILSTALFILPKEEGLQLAETNSAKALYSEKHEP
jgi:thiamine biosynthesis lipoprotein